MKRSHTDLQPRSAARLVRAVSKALVVDALRRAERSLWIGALSFEDRCMGSLLELRTSGHRFTDGVLIDYQTTVIPHTDAETLRAHNRSVAMNLSRELFENGLKVRALSPYAFDEIRELVSGQCSAGRYDLIILDISCLTKIHALALSAYLALETHDGAIIGYTIPENYGFIDERLASSPAWSDVILAPFSEAAALFNESCGRGIVVPGHEAYRLVVAIGEIEPAGGVILEVEHTGRPDLKQIMLRRNQRLIRQLGRMRSGKWERKPVSILDPAAVERELEILIEEVRPRQAPLFLFPFGPKPVLFSCALWLSARYPEGSWFVYPVPASYDINYSFGIQQVTWFSARGRVATAWS